MHRFMNKSSMWLLTCALMMVAVARTFLHGQGELFKHSKDLPEILHLVDRAYVDEVQLETLLPGLYQGALNGLDENASYVPPGMTPVNRDDEVYLRTGMVVRKRLGHAYVMQVAPESPAANTQILPETYLREINGSVTREMSLVAVRQAILENETLVRLKVIDPGKTEDREVELHPATFGQTKMQHQAYGDGLHLVRIPQFYDGLELDLRKALNQTREAASKADRNPRFVLDLRNNARGNRRHFKMLVALFLPAGDLGAWVAKGREPIPVRNETAGAFADLDLFVLHNRGTSGAAEWFTAIARDRKAAVTLGIETLGMPPVYGWVQLKNGAHLEIPIADLELSSKETLTKNGVKPDVAVKKDVKGEGDDAEPKVESAEDYLARALEAVRSYRAESAPAPAQEALPKAG
ncbi:TSPc domain-containing protein [Sulfidibacter corallicola]|uniref:Tail specific protease domain-containing protein n=1 Tax=Sulfidibacter corallicola TaxID=2818388 RepID=A0A8A4TX97_SULCO|nr:S41 family peptidase [Sulfidibacter corallicola]QTD53831.1 hypothetical protein J3U87_15385 [Sulfidibacter corallicola]